MERIRVYDVCPSCEVVRYALHHLSMVTAHVSSCLGSNCMWSPHLIFEAWRELRYSFGPSHNDCLCSVPLLILVSLTGVVIGFWAGCICTSLVLSPRLRVFLHQLVRFCLFAATDLVPQGEGRPLEVRERLRAYRA